ncbi:MAG: phosphoribosylformylglycinamidine cyclo-ligase [Spirochaetales bacterium]
MTASSYEEAGVSIRRGDAFAEYVARRVGGGIGGFAGGLEIDLRHWKRPVLLSTTDGVGTKILLAKEFGDYSTIGIDLVAMSANDLAVCGATPMSFLDYIACGSIDRTILDSVIDGILEGCSLADCVLSGGETAEMPDLYARDDIDLAGFCIGLVEQDQRLPHSDRVREGDAIIGLASSGIHSNGLSLARKALGANDPRRRELLTPTRIYVNQLTSALPYLKAAAHVTGGGIVSNLERVLPDGVEARLNWSWSVPSIFSHLASEGSIAETEMRRVFNMGIGIAMIVRPEDVAALAQALDEPLIEMGTVSGRG